MGPQSASDLCKNWWPRAQSQVKRSVFLDDFVYAITDNTVHVQDVRAMGKDIATVETAAATSMP